ncbi:MAG: hypothetical protein EAY75_03770 [Bacteroidetes bacterium]|nr:MAG: hypothetical protein EAY75_03770 [Bacteroidota bacterium]
MLISLAFAAVVIITQMLSVYGNAFSMLFGNKPFSAEPFFDAFTFFLVALGLCAWQYWVYQNESYAYSNKRVMLRTGTFSTNFVAIDYKKIAVATAEFSGADLAAVIDLAIEEKLGVSLKTGVLSPLGTKDLLLAAKRHHPTTKEWFATARNYALYSNESGQYNDILDYINKRKY